MSLSMSKLINELKIIIKKVRGGRSSTRRARASEDDDDDDEIEVSVARRRVQQTRHYPARSSRHQRSYSYADSTVETMDQGLLRYLRQLTAKPRRHKHSKKHRKHRRRHRRRSSSSSSSSSSDSSSSSSSYSTTDSSSSFSSSSSDSSSCECCQSEMRQAETLRRISRYITERPGTRGYSSRRALDQSRGRSSGFSRSQHRASPSSRSRTSFHRRRIDGRSK